MQQYLELLQRVQQHGTRKNDRTGTSLNRASQFKNLSI